MGHGIKGLEEPPGVTVGLALVDHLGVLAERAHPGPGPVRGGGHGANAADPAVDAGQRYRGSNRSTPETGNRRRRACGAG